MRRESRCGGYRERFVRSFLDWLVLSILRRKPAYGHEMAIAIEEEFHVPISSGSLYPILQDLEHSGLVTARWEDPNRRSTKMYEITVEGARTHRDGFDSIGRILASSQRTPSETRPDGRPADRGAAASVQGRIPMGVPPSEDDSFLRGLLREIFPNPHR